MTIITLYAIGATALLAWTIYELNRANRRFSAYVDEIRALNETSSVERAIERAA